MAGANVMSDVAYAMKLNEEYVGERMTSPDTSIIMALFKSAKGVSVQGRGLVYYWDCLTRGQSQGGYVAENGDLPTPGRALTQQNYVTARLGAMAVEFSDHQLQMLKGQTAGQNSISVGKILQREVKRQRERILADFFTRDDSVKARCAAAVDNSTTVYSSIPIRFVVGDKLYSYPAAGTNDERLLTGTAVTTASYIMDIDVDATDDSSVATGGKMTLSTAVTYVDDSVLTLPGAALATSILGIENHFDTVLDSSFAWDSDDAATVDHGQETDSQPYYAGLQRSSYTNLNVRTLNGGSNMLELNHLTRAAQKCIQAGGQGVANNLVALMHPLQYDRLVVTFQGQTIRSDNIQISGVDFELPVLATGSAKRIGVITTPMIKDGVVAVFPKNILGKVYRAVGWDSGELWRQTASSGSGYSAAKINYWEYFLNTFCDMPSHCCLIYGLDTSNT